MGAYLYLIIAIAVVVVLVAAGLVVSGVRSRGRRSAAEQPPAARPDTLVEQAPPPSAQPQDKVADTTLPEVAPEPTLEKPESGARRLVRLRQRLARSQSSLGRGLLTLLSRDVIDEDTWQEIEDTLLTADVGVAPTQELVDRLRTRVKVEGKSSASMRDILHEELVTLVDPSLDRSLHVDRHKGLPAIVLMVGVNGTGKTTTVGKLARVLVAEDKQVVLGAADTFRAAAAEQLATWGERVGVPAVRGAEGSDPASVAFEAVKSGVEREADVVVVDTAGRLQNKAGLMDELGKVKRVIEKQAPVSEVLLVLDATTGQNGMTQARVFREVVDVTGIVLTKLDGSAKGGIVVAVQRELGVPVKLVGVGEGADDLAPFDPEAFVDALLGEANED
ncbi:MAG TPA: signal recognition particle-docking protein FtsY [Nocardioidaceae bacterium]|nr:signal recognition particle-docking protein FtsY [Nocardioidaceae bacterium]